MTESACSENPIASGADGLPGRFGQATTAFWCPPSIALQSRAGTGISGDA